MPSLSETSQNWATLPSFGSGLIALWFVLCGAGLWGLWDLMLHYHQYTLKTLSWKIKAGIPLGFVGASPFAIGANWEPIVVFMLIPLLIVIQFYILIARNEQTPPNSALNADAQKRRAG